MYIRDSFRAFLYVLRFAYFAAVPNCLSLPFDYPDYSFQPISLLLDPLGSVHAVTGTLPVTETSLPSRFYMSALTKMAVSFRIGPVLANPASVRLPVPVQRSGVWSWVWQTAPGTYQTDAIVAASDLARLTDAPPDLMEGWLVLSPSRSGGD